MRFVIAHTHGGLKLSCTVRAESKETAEAEFWRQEKLIWGAQSKETKITEMREEP